MVTTDLDAERSVVWNMGAIAVHAADKTTGDAALNLFRTVLLASGAVPGAFPPVLIDVEGNGKKFQEMHVDGGVGGQFFVAPGALLQSNSDYKIPATALYIVINSGLRPSFAVVEPSTPSILTQSVGMAVEDRSAADARPGFCRGEKQRASALTSPPFRKASARRAAERSIPNYMQALFAAGFDQGKSDSPFATAPPPYPGAAGNEPSGAEKSPTGSVEQPGADK